MKNLDNFSKRVLALGVTIMGVTLCATLLVATINRVSATGTASTPMPSVLSENGRIMMDYTSVHVPSQDKTYYEVIVWDTQTGRSKLYFYSYTDKTFKAYEANVQLPASPLD